MSVLAVLSCALLAAPPSLQQVPLQPPPAVAAQPADAIDDEALLLAIEARCAELRGKGELLPVSKLRAGAEGGRGCGLPALAPRTEPLSPPDLYQRTLQSTLIVGHYHPCEECERWHFSAASGFAVSADGAVATSWHLLLDDPAMPDALLAAADLRGHVWPVQRVLAADPRSDLCVVQIPARDLVPLPLRPGVRVGEAVWCLSHPDHQFAVFTAGMVARRYVLREPPGVGEPDAPASAVATGPAATFLHVTVEFAGGSSGAPVLDACGNVVGVAQSTTTMVHDFASEQPDVQMVLRTASPAAALAAIVRGGG